MPSGISQDPKYPSPYIQHRISPVGAHRVLSYSQYICHHFLFSPPSPIKTRSPKSASTSLLLSHTPPPYLDSPSTSPATTSPLAWPPLALLATLPKALAPPHTSQSPYSPRSLIPSALPNPFSPPVPHPRPISQMPLCRPVCQAWRQKDGRWWRWWR